MHADTAVWRLGPKQGLIHSPLTYFWIFFTLDEAVASRPNSFAPSSQNRHERSCRIPLPRPIQPESPDVLSSRVLRMFILFACFLVHCWAPAISNVSFFILFFAASISPWICKSWFFINHSAKTVSGWTLVAVTFERTLLVYWPLKAKDFTNRRLSFVVISAICFLCSIVYIHYFWSYGRKYEIVSGKPTLIGFCSVNAKQPALSFYMENIRPWQDLLIRSAIPFFILLICNVLIIVRLAHQHKMKKAKMTSTDVEGNRRKEEKMRSVTAMLLTVSFTHLMCISPMQIMYVIDKSDPFGWTITERWQALVALRWGFAVAVYYLNHAINFILYVVSSSEFRKDFIHFWLKIKGPIKCLNNRVAPASTADSSTLHWTAEPA